MIKHWMVAAGFSLVSGFAMAQNVSLETEDLLGIDACTGMMSPQELLAAADRLKQKNTDNDDFFSANCILISAHKGDAESQYQLALAYKNGYGLPISDVHAYKWFKIAQLNGKEIDQEMLMSLEEGLTIEDFKVSSQEISSFLSFEEKLEKVKNDSALKDVLVNYGNISEKQLKAIQESQKDIDALFKEAQNFGEKSNKGTSASKLKNRIPARNEINYEQELIDQEREFRKKMEASTAESRKREEVSSTTTSSTKSNSVADRTAKIDFYTDKYNPQFNPPPAGM